jgi:hypothetical protein
MAELLQYSSAGGRWEFRELRVLHDPGTDVELRCWHEDAVFSLGELMCWADYHKGILFRDVAAADPELRFVPFPGIDVRRDYTNGPGAPE